MFQPISLPFKIRQSNLETARCLFRFQKIEILGLRKILEPDSEASERGNQIHAMAKLYVDYLVASKQEMDHTYAQRIVDEGNWNRDAINIFLRWVKDKSFDPAIIFATEYKVRLNWDLEPCSQEDAVFSGDIDMLEVFGPHAKILDLKSHWAAFEPTTIQAILYAWFIFQLMPHITHVTFTLDFVRWGILKSREFTREQLPELDRYVSNQVQRLVRAYETDLWPAAVNAGCVYCRLECPLVAAGLSRNAIGQISSDEQAQEIAREMFALRHAYQQKHAALKGWATMNGAVDAGNDIKLGFSKRETFEFQVDTIMRLNEEHGFKPTRALAVSSREVRRIGKKYPEYESAAQAEAEDTSTTTFKFVNEKGDPLEDESDGY